jgi:hypothetical protein
MKARIVVAVTLCGASVGAMTAGCPGPRRELDASVGIDAPIPDVFVPPGADAAADAVVTPMDDAFVTPTDDAFVPPMIDAFVPPMIDAAATPDAFVPSDAFLPATDAFVSTMPCDQIAAIRLRTGTFAPGLPVTGAIVSYVMPALPAGSTDPRGVFVQCPGTVGPALFLAISPEDTTAFPTAPTVGSVVSFTVTAASDATGAGGTGDQHRVTAISGWSASGTGAIAAQDVSAVGVPAMLDGLESELVSFDATIAAAGTPAGTGFTSFRITTTGVTTATTDFRLRMPTDVASALSLVAGCQVRLASAPLWRFNTSAQPSVFTAGEVAVVSCPATCTPPDRVVINEVDYDNPSTDTMEFVELFNPTASSVSLTGWTLVHVDGGTGNELGRVALTGSIPAGGYLVVQGMGSTVAGATLTLSSAMQNGPDGIVLLGPDGVVDAAMYEGTIGMVTLMGGMTITVSESASIGTDPGAGALGRTPNGCDRNTPAMDWSLRAMATPGAANM